MLFRSAYTTEAVDEKYRLNKGDVVIGMDGNFHMNIWQDDNAFSLMMAYVVVVVQSPSPVRLFGTPWTAAHQASLSLTIAWNLPKFMFIASVLLSSHLIL